MKNVEDGLENIAVCRTLEESLVGVHRIVWLYVDKFRCLRRVSGCKAKDYQPNSCLFDRVERHSIVVLPGVAA